MAPLVLVVGMPGCGKGEFVSVAPAFGYRILSLGDIVRSEARRRGKDVKASGAVAVALREELGEAALALCALPHLQEGEKTLIDGIRSHAEVAAFKKVHDAVVVGIHASPATRYARLSARGREDDPRTWEAFAERDVRELGFGIGNAIALADTMIVNEGGVEDLHRAAETVLEGIDHGVYKH